MAHYTLVLLSTGETQGRLWWWLIQVITLTAAFDLRIKGMIDQLWVIER